MNHLSKIKVAWICSFPEFYLTEQLRLSNIKKIHPLSWVRVLSLEIVKYNIIDLHIISVSTLINKDYVINDNGITYHFIKTNKIVRFFTFYYFDKIKIVSVLKRLHPDVVHAHGTEDVNSVAALKYSRNSIISVQGIIECIKNRYPNKLSVDFFRYTVLAFLENLTLKKAKYFIAKSEFSRTFLSNKNPSSKVFLIHNPVSESYFKVKRKASSKLKILFVGNLIPMKGIEDLLVSMSILIDEYPDILLKVIGAGKNKYVNEFILPKIRELSINNNIELLGFKNSDEIAQELSDCTMLVLPSYFENSPNCLAEAAVVGVPIIATNVGGIPNFILHRNTGLLYEVGDIKGLVDNIKLIIVNKNLGNEVSINAQNIARAKFSTKSQALKVIDLYKELLK